MASISFIPMEVSRQMRSREKPLWIGKPNAKKFVFKESGSTFLAGIAGTAFAVFWIFRAIAIGNMISVLIGVALVAIGLYLLTTPLQAYWRAQRTIYVVSNQRLIILNGLMRPTVESFVPSNIGSLDIEIASDGSGSIIFQERRGWPGQGGLFFRKIGFKSIARLREAETHILEIKGLRKREASSGERSQDSIENYRGYEIEHDGDGCSVGDYTFVDSASAKAHIDANWARSRQ